MLIAEKVLSQIKPPPDSSTFDDIVLLAQNHSVRTNTVCLLSTFYFVKKAIKKIILEDIPGDILLAGVWRGGLAAYIQALLVDNNATNRTLYLADVFDDIINIRQLHPRDKKMLEYATALNIPPGNPAGIKKLFLQFDLLLTNVVFLEGDIKNTTSDFTHKLAMLLVDLDFYTSTRDCLNNLYKTVAENGIIYIDDYKIPMFACKEAVDEFIKENQLDIEIASVNKIGISWIKRSHQLSTDKKS